jgi:putative membrane protein
MSENEKPLSPSSNKYTGEARIRQDLNTFALVRTAFSAERSLMAALRTSVSLFTFGFSITKFFDYLKQQQAVATFSEGPRYLGLALIGVGILSLVSAVVEHVWRLRKMKELGLPTISWFSLPIGTTFALLAIGITILIAIGFS